MSTHLTKSLPIIVVHFGASPYLDVCLQKAKETNPASRVILLGDAANAGIPPVCDGLAEHYDVRHLHTADITELENIYRHRSSLREDFELFCIKRWFYLRNFCREQGIPRCLCLDSDVLVFCDVTREAEAFPPCDITVGKWDDNAYLIHTAFVYRTEIFNRFTDYILNVYRHPDILAGVVAANRKKNGNVWISDMHLFYDFAQKDERIRLAFLEDRLRDDGVCFDPRISNTSGFLSMKKWLFLRRMKRITFENGVPYGILKAGRRKIPFRTIHYNGSAKFLMKYHAAGQAPFWKIFGNRWKMQAKRLAEQVRRCFQSRKSAKNNGG